MRIKAINLIIAVIFVLIAAAVFNLAVIQGRRFKDLSDRNSIRLIRQPGSRGKILDRNGQVIVDNCLSYDLLILPQGQAENEKTLSAVSDILGIEPKELNSRFRRGYLASFLPVCVANSIDSKKAFVLEELKYELPGVIIQVRPLRRYPHGNLAAHVIGYLGEIDRWRLMKWSDYGYNAGDTVGFGGVEEKFDKMLRQEEGALSVEVDHRGRFVRVLGYKPPRSGKDIQLTLDIKLQKVAETHLGQRIGCVIIMEPASGEILAMASSPSFNPAAFVNRSSSYISRLIRDTNAPLINRAISGVYPPGSIFKLIVAVGALESGKINSKTTFFCPGSLQIGRRQFRCWDTHNQEDLIQAIAHSCDVFFYKTGIAEGAQNIHDYALKFGLSRPLGIDLPAEAGGNVPSPLARKMQKFQNWYDGDTANFAIGQGDLMVTPLQMVRMAAVFANKGILVNPYIVKQISGYNISRLHRKSARAPFKTVNMDYIRQGMRQTIADPAGTANVLSGLKVTAAGKTGTVQVPRGQPHAWFTGYFPYKEPKYVICVFLEHGGSGYASCVLTRQIIESMAQEGLI